MTNEVLSATTGASAVTARTLPYAFAKAKGVVLVSVRDGRAALALRSNASLDVLAEVQRVLGMPFVIERVNAVRFDELMASAYAAEGGAMDVRDFEQHVDLSRLIQDLPEVDDLLDAQDGAPIIRMINALLTNALRENASDIHIEPFESRSLVRFRVDGSLRDVIEPNRAIHAALVSRIKVMAQLDIAEKRLPQDGRIGLRLGGRPVDVRVSTIPSGYGERVVLRLLDKEAGRLDLAKLGMDEITLERIKGLARQPHGILLVTGPTGSGKTTTLYAALGQIDTRNMNVMTVEDPIEYYLDGIGQTQVNTRIDMTFAKALRSILRQDPDVIMIGEIRDLETAEIAIQASLTGHLVLATLHTNDAVSSVTRLIDMGIEPFLLASSLVGVLAQRLVRQLCPDCKRAASIEATERHLIGEKTSPDRIWHPVGCPTCNQTGYRGRSGIYELMTVDAATRRLIHDRASEPELQRSALEGGMTSLRQDAMRGILSGQTSLEEVLRVTRAEGA